MNSIPYAIHKRPFSKTLSYYTFRIVGPLILIAGVLFIALIVWFISLLPLQQKHPIYTTIIFVISLVPLVMYLYCVLFTLLVDPGETTRAINNPKYKRFLTQEFLESLPKCKKCGLPKPERCHHCSLCNKCHLRMDHHCPAVGVCIALNNTQSFIIMLRWALVLIFVNICECIQAVFLLPQMKAPSLILTFLLLVLGGTLLFFAHDSMKRVLVNQTTLEQMSGEDDLFNLGKEENIRQLFGSGKMRMWIPRKNRLTGFEWSLPNYQKESLLQSNGFVSV